MRPKSKSLPRKRNRLATADVPARADRSDADLPWTYAPAFRASDADVLRQHALFVAKAALQPVLDAVPFSVVVLNHWRQIIYANAALLGLIGRSKIQEVLGKRLGEVVGCQHAFQAQGGCGTTDFCRYCGGIHAMLRAIELRRADVQECRISRVPGGDALDLRVWSRPIVVDDEAFVVFSFLDIGAEKRKEVLERLFFHDIANTASGLSGIAELLPSAAPHRIAELAGMIHMFSRQLLDEINGQRELMMAESGSLHVHAEPTDIGALVDGIIEAYRHYSIARGRHIHFKHPGQPVIVRTDRSIAGRVIGNMLKNAIEATPEGAEVTVHCADGDGRATVGVSNPGHMPKHVQMQLFKRSFSTKGEGRGIGTYSMKLLGEQYLKGKIEFTSAPGEGTTFRLGLPSLPIE